MVSPHEFHPEGSRKGLRSSTEAQEEKGVVRVDSRELGDRGLGIQVDPMVIG